MLPDVEYRLDFIDPGEEAVLVAEIEKLELQEARYKQFTARRRVASFGAGYDFEANELTPAPDPPDFVLPVRERLAQWARIDAASLGYVLIAEYRPGTQLGWHRDSPQFEMVAGVSLASACRMRFRRYPPRPREKAYDLTLEPRSAYLLRGDMRWEWQHSIPPTPALRYSITFRSRK